MITKLPAIASRTTSRLLHTAPRAAAAASLNVAAAPSQQQQQHAWSGSLSYATPEADFTALHVSANSATVEAEWSQEHCFASPDSDFTAALVNEETSVPAAASLDLQTSASSATVESEWAQQIVLADAKKDVAQLMANLETNEEDKLDETAVNQMLHQLSLSSPESALGYTHVAETMSETVKQEFKAALDQKGLPATLPEEEEKQEVALDQSEVDRMMQQLHLSSPESALGVTHVAEVMTDEELDQLSSYYEFKGQAIPNPLPEEPSTAQMDDLLVQQMLLSSPESATGYVHAAETLTDHLKAQLQQVTTPLPTSLQEALAPKEHRAIVVTQAKAPFRVVHVNDVWEGLCGYTQQEAANKPIGDLLRGPETRTSRRMVNALKEHPETPQAALLVNYTKEGRKFHNRLQVGPLYAEQGGQEEEEVIEYLVGVLQEVQEQQGVQMAA